MTRWENVKNRFCSVIGKQIKEKPYKVALGCAFGIGVNFIPTLGIGFVFAFLLAVLFKANRASAAATSLLTGPLIPLMYALNFVTGGLILTPVTGKENLREFVVNQYAIILRLGNIQEKIFGFLEFFGFTFIFGAAVNAALFGTVFYFFVSYILNKNAR